MESRRGEGREVGVQSLAIKDPIRLCHVGHTRTDHDASGVTRPDSRGCLFQVVKERSRRLTFYRDAVILCVCLFW